MNNSSVPQGSPQTSRVSAARPNLPPSSADFFASVLRTAQSEAAARAAAAPTPRRAPVPATLEQLSGGTWVEDICAAYFGRKL